LWRGKTFFDKPWNILPSHIYGLFWNQQWLIDFEHGFAQESYQEQHCVSVWKQFFFEGCILYPSCNQCSKCLLLLDNNYNNFKNVEMNGNCILEKYLMKINFSKYINYLTNMCWNGWGIMILYLNIHHFIMIEKLQNGEKNHWAETKI